MNKFFEYIGERRTLVNNILRRIASWIDLILRRNCLIDNAIEGKMMELKGVGRRRRRRRKNKRTQLLDVLRNRRRY